ncbi:MAG: tRNA dimethylallyltransferase [Alphaproteobacteria bacterium MarineAlpha9_Bin3]|nr:MAG: tRNA dimethylallyltransferase [Alphaproteobacteria bacterium MarineAlpha9_Bin3]|tara:strand:+ start:2482 stop:3303 length:822 start_codon:yes stop_codon:yes gene_type:complete
MQVYKELKIISARPNSEAERIADHKLYGFISGKKRCSALLWSKKAVTEINKALNKGVVPILVGGTGLYVKTLMDGISDVPITSDKNRKIAENLLQNDGADNFYIKLQNIDKNLVKNINLNDKQRLIRSYSVWLETGKTLHELRLADKKINMLPNSFLKIQLSTDREVLRSNIKKRFFDMIDQGALKEVKKVEDFDKTLPIMKAHGVRELLSVNKNEISLKEAAEITINHINQYAKRQETWFRHQYNTDYKILNFKDNIDKYCSNVLSLYSKLY